MLRTATVVASVVSVGAHSWLTQPNSHNANGGRGGVITGACEPQRGAVSITKVKAGDMLTTVWPPMGHAGGFNRFALIPLVAGAGTPAEKAAFEVNVLQTNCYGGGECGTCVSGNSPYRADVQMPTNLPDGKYTLQWWCYGTGNGLPDYYSCADVEITGGDENQVCADHIAPTETCWHCSTDQCDPNKGTSAKRIKEQKSGKFCFGPPTPPPTIPPPPTTPAPTNPGAPPTLRPTIKPSERYVAPTPRPDFTNPNAKITLGNAQCFAQHQVRAGESLDSIAALFNTNSEDIVGATGFEDDAYCNNELVRTGFCPQQCQWKGSECGTANSPTECDCTGVIMCRAFNIYCLDVGHKLRIPQLTCVDDNPESPATSVTVGLTSLVVAGLAMM